MKNINLFIRDNIKSINDDILISSEISGLSSQVEPLGQIVFDTQLPMELDELSASQLNPLTQAEHEEAVFTQILLDPLIRPSGQEVFVFISQLPA